MRTQTVGADRLRIVSLSPALTQMLRDLGLAEQLVGTGEVDPVAPPHATPVGHFRQIDYEKLLALRPTHLIIQDTHKEPESEKLRRLAERHDIQIVRPKLETTGDITVALHALGQGLGMAAEAEELARRVEEQMRALSTLTAGQPRPRVLLAVSTSPRIMAAAPETFLNSVLEAAGGVNAIEHSSVLYPELDSEALLALAPQIIVHIRTPGSQQQLHLPVGLKATVCILEDHAALLPSSSLPRIASRLAAMLHPDLQKAIRASAEELAR